MRFSLFLLLIMFGLLFASCRTGVNQNVSLKNNKNLIARYINEIVNTGDTSRITEFIGEDYTEVYLGERYPIRIRGAIDHVNGVRAVYDDFRIEID